MGSSNMPDNNSFGDRVFRRNVILSAIGMLAIAIGGVFLKGLPGFHDSREASATTAPVFQDAQGIAIHGHDPLGYFSEGKPVKGKPEHSLKWNGATWWFVSEENKAKFAEMPETYAPRYGGYCAYAASQGYIASTVPEAWTIQEGKLYLNYSLSVKEKFDADREAYISKADQNWPELIK